MNVLTYLLTASLYFTLFIGCYWLILRRNTFFNLNRAYLLGSVMLSLTLPLLDVSTWWTNETRTAVGTITLPTFSTRAPVEASGPTLEQAMGFIYGLGVLCMLGRLMLRLRAVGQLIGRGSHERRRAYTLVRLPDSDSVLRQIPSFSFGRYLVLNSTDAATEPDALMRHEEAHIRQYHTADVLFMELVWAGFWFNPVLWFYKRAIQEVHEFLADRTASGRATLGRATLESAILTSSNKGRKPEYAQQLVAYALNVPATALTTPFSSLSTLKQRIIMLQKPASHRRALLGYALVLPLAGLLTLCTQPEQDQPATETERARAVIDRANARKPANVNGEIFTVVENQPEFPGGMKELGAYLEKNLRYPAAAQKANVQGRVFINFVVTKDGTITDINLLKGIGSGADEEAMRVVAEMPRWKPGTQSGQPVNVRYNLPINFQLDDDMDASNPPSVNVSDKSDRIDQYTIDGKIVTKAAVDALDPKRIARVDVTKNNGKNQVAIKTK